MIANCEFLYETQSKELQENEYAVNITVRMRASDRKRTRVSISYVFDLLYSGHINCSDTKSILRVMLDIPHIESGKRPRLRVR